MKKILLAAAVAAFMAAAAQAAPAEGFSDPALQDFVETAYGYLNPANRPAGLRDAPVSSGYVLVSILPRRADYSALLRDLGAAGFLLRGERVSGPASRRRTSLVGWARSSSLEAIRANSGVAGLRVLPGGL